MQRQVGDLIGTQINPQAQFKDVGQSVRRIHGFRMGHLEAIPQHSHPFIELFILMRSDEEVTHMGNEPGGIHGIGINGDVIR